MSDAYAPNDPSIRTVNYRQNDARGEYTAATGSGPFSALLSRLQPGLNYVSLFAVDAMEGTSANQGANLMIGAPKVFALSAVGLPVFAETSPLNSAVVGVAYGQPIAVSGGVGILSFTVTAGALPPGLLLSTTGYLSGTPTDPGTSSFTVTVIDASGNTASRVLSMNVAALTLLNVRSRKTHGAAGAFELTIDKEQAAAGAVTVEPRVIGNGHDLVFGFNSAISSAGTVTAKNGSGTPLQSVVTLPYVNSVVVTLPAVSDNSRATISLSGSTVVVSKLKYPLASC